MEVPNTTLKSKHTSKERIIQGTLEKYVLGEKTPTQSTQYFAIKKRCLLIGVNFKVSFYFLTEVFL